MPPDTPLPTEEGVEPPGAGTPWELHLQGVQDSGSSAQGGQVPPGVGEEGGEVGGSGGPRKVSLTRDFLGRLVTCGCRCRSGLISSFLPFKPSPARE